MAHEIIIKKLEQIDRLLTELSRLLSSSFAIFKDNIDSIRAAERNFELIIELASDVNNEIALVRGLPIADTYRSSFTQLETAAVISKKLGDMLIEGARIRNILVHEYDFEEDYEKFYESVKRLLPAYREYVSVIHEYAVSHGVSKDA
jgi:uncharacterized protein YutE (UPF0331/DUF86 family)